MRIVTVIFVMSSLALLHTYVFYPFVLQLMRKKQHGELRGRSDLNGGALPGASQSPPIVSVIIPFHNEERWVARKLDNLLSCDYPANRLQVIAVSDGSRDMTTNILERYKDRIQVIAYQPRRGKPTALNLGVAHAQGEILIFTDANVMLEPKAIRAMVARYEDPTVGAVSGKIALQPDGAGEPLGEGIYMRYEQWLYSLESEIQTMIVGDGAFFSVRRELFTPLPSDTITDDFALALQVVGKGRRLIYEPAACGVEVVIPSVSAEFGRKVRMVAGGYQALGRLHYLLNPYRFPLVAFQLISHKLLRWWAPFFLVPVFVGAALRAGDHPLFAGALAVQCVFYGLAGAGWSSARLRQLRVVYLPYYFCATNVAAVQGLWRFLHRRQAITWERVGR